MAMIKEMMGGGVSSGMARAINGGVASSVSAAGTTLATATALNAGHNVITTCAASAGVSLPSCEIGDEIFVYNGTSTNQLSVYPDASGNTINQLAAGFQAFLSPYTGALFKRATSTAWTGILSA